MVANAAIVGRSSLASKSASNRSVIFTILDIPSFLEPRMPHNVHSNEFITCQQTKLFLTHEHTPKLLALDHPHFVLEIFDQPVGHISLHHMGIPQQAYFARTRNFGCTLGTIVSCITNRYICIFMMDPKYVLSTQPPNHLSFDISKKAFLLRTRNFGSATTSLFSIC